MTSNAVPLSTRVRTQTQQDHSSAEESTFIRDLMAGDLDLTAYTAFAKQLWFVYGALEQAAPALASDPVVGGLLDPGLARLAALEADLDTLDPAWRAGIDALPATRAYVERIREVASRWPGGYLAHHYTRYLGDLSGGQVVRTMMQRHYSVPPDAVSFFDFPLLANKVRFKEAYRARLDALPWDDSEQDRFVAEVSLAYRLNSGIFDELAPVTAG